MPRTHSIELHPSSSHDELRA